MKYLLTMLFSIAAILGGHANASSTKPPVWMTTPCAYEDSSNCFWDAGAAGDQHGHSFYSIRVGDQDCIVFWDNRYARRHNHCI